MRMAVTPGVTWPPEIELLLACARLRLEPEHVLRIRSILEMDIDWKLLFRLTFLHRMTAFVFNHLNAAAPDLVPKENLEFLQSRFIQYGAEALRQTAELLKVMELFEDGGVYAVPYKGHALAVAIYGNLAYRACSDLDILVERKDVRRARQLLENAGFEPQFQVSEAAREFLLKTRHSEIFTRPSSLMLELHWAFAKQRGVFPLDLEQLRPRLREISLGGGRIPMFAPEDQLLVLCVHGANHLWSRLEWICGISELIRNQRLDWNQTLQRAGELRATRKLFLGLVLARDLLDCPVPSNVLIPRAGDREVARAARIVKGRLAMGRTEMLEPPNSWLRDLFRLRLESGTGDRFRYVVHRLTTPGREDTRLMLPLGRLSIPLSTIYRPFHIVGKLIGDLVRHPSP